MQNHNKPIDARTKQIYVSFFLILLLIFGASNSILVKWQNETKGENGMEWDHPYF